MLAATKLRPSLQLWRRACGRGRAWSWWIGLALFFLAYALITPELNSAGGLPWNQGSNYALGRALADGTAKVDRYAWQTDDLSYFHGHYYSVRAPGLSFVELPVFEVARAAGVPTQGKWDSRDRRGGCTQDDLGVGPARGNGARRSLVGIGAEGGR